MKRFRYVTLAAAWAGLIWLTVDAANSQPIAESFWANLAYIIALIAVAILLFVAIFPLLARKLRLSVGVMIAIGVIMLFAIAAIDFFWLRDVIRTGI